jgi:hypothetical protein
MAGWICDYGRICEFVQICECEKTCRYVAQNFEKEDEKCFRVQDGKIIPFNFFKTVI